MYGNSHSVICVGIREENLVVGKSSVIAVCTVSAAICIIESLVSGTRLKNQMKMILDLVLIAAAAAPFFKGGIDLDLSGLNIDNTIDYSHSHEIYN